MPSGRDSFRRNRVAPFDRPLYSTILAAQLPRTGSPGGFAFHGFRFLALDRHFRCQTRAGAGPSTQFTVSTTAVWVRLPLPVEVTVTRTFQPVFHWGLLRATVRAKAKAANFPARNLLHNLLQVLSQAPRSPAPDASFAAGVAGTATMPTSPSIAALSHGLRSPKKARKLGICASWRGSRWASAARDGASYS
jgi:hypothetical protein